MLGYQRRGGGAVIFPRAISFDSKFGKVKQFSFHLSNFAATVVAFVVVALGSAAAGSSAAILLFAESLLRPPLSLYQVSVYVSLLCLWLGV